MNMNKKNLLFIPILILAGIGIFVVISKLSESGGQGDPVRKSSECKISDNNQLPDNWPNDIPLQPEAKINSSQCDPTGMNNFDVKFRTDTSFASVVDFYNQYVKSQGWEFDQLNNSGPFPGYTNYKSTLATKNNRSLIILVRQGDKTDMQVETVIQERLAK